MWFHPVISNTFCPFLPWFLGAPLLTETTKRVAGDHGQVPGKDLCMARSSYLESDGLMASMEIFPPRVGIYSKHHKLSYYMCIYRCIYIYIYLYIQFFYTYLCPPSNLSNYPIVVAISFTMYVWYLEGLWLIMINRLGFRRLEACIHWKIGNYQYDEKTKKRTRKNNKQTRNKLHHQCRAGDSQFRTNGPMIRKVKTPTRCPSEVYRLNRYTMFVLYDIIYIYISLIVCRWAVRSETVCIRFDGRRLESFVKDVGTMDP